MLKLHTNVQERIVTGYMRSDWSVFAVTVSFLHGLFNGLRRSN